MMLHPRRGRIPISRRYLACAVLWTGPDAGFAVRQGEIFVVMGFSGSDKSTLVRMLNWLIEPSVGTIHIDDQGVTAMSRSELINLRWRDVGMMFQPFALMPHRAVLGNVAFGLEVAGVVGKALHPPSAERP